jgi:hypothetical protein
MSSTNFLYFFTLPVIFLTVFQLYIVQVEGGAGGPETKTDLSSSKWHCQFKKIKLTLEGESKYQNNITVPNQVYKITGHFIFMVVSHP